MIHPEISGSFLAHLMAKGNLRHLITFGLFGLTCSVATSQQSIPADIAARDKELRDSIQREDIRARNIEHRAHMERDMQDMVRRFWEEPWLAKSAGSQHDLVFPPVLPPELHGLASAEPAGAYPDFLIAYSGEPFFMACGNSAFAGLNDGHQFYRASRYVETRDQLVAELRAKLAAVQSLTLEQQQTELAVFAAAQANALRNLESEAEGTRDEFNYLDDGRALMKEKNALTPDEATRLRTYYAALRAAHYMPGLSIDQRQLLESVAFETSSAPDPADRDRSNFFLPASARIRWLHSDDPQLSARWAFFQQLRRELAQQLVQSALELPPNISRSAARRLHARLAEQQAIHFAELDRVAEEIRFELAKNPRMKAPADSGHPSELIRQVGELRDRNRRFQDRAAHLLQEMNRRLAPSRFRMGSSREGPAIELEPTGTDAAPKAGKRSQQSQQLRKANEWLAQTSRELRVAEEEATKAIQNYHASLDLKQAPGVEKLTESLVQAHLHRENWHRFADYRTAVLMPGLSPAQRRLLFNAALRDLEKHRLQAMD